MVSLIFIFLLSSSFVVFGEKATSFQGNLAKEMAPVDAGNLDLDKAGGLDITEADLKKAEQNIIALKQGMMQQIKAMPKEEIVKFKKLTAQIKKSDLANNPLEEHFFQVWYPKHKQAFSAVEQKQYEDAWKKGKIKGMSAEEGEKVFTSILLSDGKIYIIPTNLVYGFQELMTERIPLAFESLKIKIEKQSDITPEVLTKIFDKLAQDGGVDSLLYDMLFMRVFQRTSQEWQEVMFSSIK